MQEKNFTGLTFAIDFDGTCVFHCFPKIGEDCPDAVDTLQWIVDNGGKLLLNTMRSDDYEKGQLHLKGAVCWFDKHGLPLSGINTNPGQSTWTSSPKVYANVYIDDAALGCPLIMDRTLCDRPFVDWKRVKEMLCETYLFVEKIHVA